MQLLFVNISAWGPLMEEFLASQKSRHYHVIGVAEHHKEQPGVQSLKKVAKHRWGRRLLAAAARRKPGGGPKETEGGVMLLPKAHLRLGTMNAWGAAPGGTRDLQSTGKDWVITPLMLQGTTVLVVSLYLTCSTGVARDNIVKLGSLAECLKKDGRLFVIMGDWNMTPGELMDQGSHWLQLVGGVIKVPEGAAHTCVSGRTIDFLVVSAQLQNAVRVELELALPWKTHSGLRVLLRRRPGQLVYTAVHVPRRLDKLPDRTVDDVAGKADATSASAHSVQVDGRGDSEVNFLKVLSGTPLSPFVEDTAELGDRYAAWSERAEGQLLARKDTGGER